MEVKKTVNKSVTPDNVYFENGVLYFTLMEINLLGIIDLTNKTIHYFSGPSEERNVETCLYGGICKWKNYLVLAPYNASRLWIYDLNTGKWEGLAVDEFTNRKAGGFFTGVEVFGDDILLIGYGCDCILKLNMENFELSKAVGYADIGIAGMRIWAKSHVRKHETVYLAVNDSNQVVKYNMSNSETKVFELGNGKKFAGITESEGFFWIVSYLSNELLKWNEEKDEVVSYVLPRDLDIWGATCIDDRLLFFQPYYNTFEFDIKANEYYERDYKATQIIKLDDSLICILGLGTITIADRKNLLSEKEKYAITVADNVIDAMFDDNCLNREGLLKESVVFNLQNYIRAI